ncbi:MAG: hypothetical protein ABIH82_05905 [Candidatus Woesearchaeota archaeon]
MTDEETAKTIDQKVLNCIKAAETDQGTTLYRDVRLVDVFCKAPYNIYCPSRGDKVGPSPNAMHYCKVTPSLPDYNTHREKPKQ